MTLRAYKFRIYPTRAQRAVLRHDFNCARFVWNVGLEMRSRAYKEQGLSLSGTDISRQITQLKKDTNFDWLKAANAGMLVQKLRDQDSAFNNFFAKRTKYPRFKKKGHGQSVRYQLDQRRIDRLYRGGELLRLPKIGALKVKWSQIPKGTPKMVTVSVNAAGQYFVSMAVEETIEALPKTGSSIGIDMGIKALGTGTDGVGLENPRYLQQSLRQLKRASRALSRKKKDSSRWHRQRQKVAKLHQRIKNQRNDYLHKVSTQVVKSHDVVCLEDLNIKGMVKNRRLARHISDAAMSELVRQIEYKAGWYGKWVQKIDPWFPSSKLCSCCGYKLDELNLSVRHWTCPKCHTYHDRDQNAAANILAEGLNQLGRGTPDVRRVEGDTHLTVVPSANGTTASGEARNDLPSNTCLEQVG